jgi:poly(A) polymerase
MTPTTDHDRIIKILARLVKNTEFEGKVFLAGGAVRDEIMGHPIKDIDIVVALPGGGIKFATWVTNKLGLRDPVVWPRYGTAVFSINGIDIEVVMTRGEKYETGNRKPEVVYADLTTDALRRDLTVNSLFKDIVTGEIKDMTGKGIADITAGVVRTPLDPEETFEDDPLRMLRVVRFAVKYNWKIPRSILHALKTKAYLLPNISQERIQGELNKMLMTDRPDTALRILTKTGLNQYILPELDTCQNVTQNEHHKDDVYDHILDVVKNTPKDLSARLAAIFHDIGKPQTRAVTDSGKVTFHGHEDIGADIAANVLRRLRYTNDQVETVKTVVERHMDLKTVGPNGENVTDKQLRKFAVRLGPHLTTALKMMHADNISHAEQSSMPNQIPSIIKKLETVVQGNATQKPTLPINGNDVIRTLGIKPGPDVKKYLNVVLDAWYKDPNISKNDAIKMISAVHTTKPRKPVRALDIRFINPKTGNKILVRTGLKYPKEHPTHQLALKILRTEKN